MPPRGVEDRRYREAKPPGGKIVEQVGVAFRALNPRRQAFVVNYVTRGRRNATQAYIDAGYNTANRDTARVNACLLLHNDKIQAAIQEYTIKQLVTFGPIANQVAVELLENPQTPPETRAKIAFGILDRTGAHAKTEHKVTVEHIGDDPAAMAQARELVQRLGLNAEQIKNLLGRTLGQKVIDGEYTEVDEAERDEDTMADASSSQPDSESLALPPPEGEAEPEEVQEIEEIRFE